MNTFNTLCAQEYIDWLNGYLPQTEAVNDISKSLADGTLMLKALSVRFYFFVVC